MRGLAALLLLALGGCYAPPPPYAYAPYPRPYAPPVQAPYEPVAIPLPRPAEPPLAVEPSAPPDPLAERTQGLTDAPAEPPALRAEEPGDPVTELLLTPLPQRDAAQAPGVAPPAAVDKTPSRDPFMGFRPMRGQTTP